MKNKLLYSLFFFLFLAQPLYARLPDSTREVSKPIFNGPPPSTDTSVAEPVNPKVATAAVVTVASSPFNSFEFLLSLAVLFFGLVIVVLEVVLAMKGKIDSDHIMKVIILTMVIIGSVVLITAGYSNNQITGASGILGSIAGYMLGKTELRGKATPQDHTEHNSTKEKTPENEKK